MRKYLYVFTLSLQNVLQRRASLLMDRVGGLATILALYYFWVSLLQTRDQFLGYTRIQMLSYVLLMNVLRAFVFTGRGWELVGDISHGRISSYLLRPISYQGYSLSLDLAQKVIHLASACLEIGLFVVVFQVPIYLPQRAETWLLFLAAVASSSLLFFLTFNLVDIVAQVFFRGIYGARRAVQDGELDYYLVQPYPPLMRLAASTVDFLDIATLLPVLALLGLIWPSLPPGIGPGQVALYGLLVCNGIAIALTFHIVVAALAVRTQELENTIWIYRDMMFLGRFPVDIYSAPLRLALTVLVPIGVMTSFPAKALLGALSPAATIYALGLAAAAVAFSLWLWRDALARYTSVSS